MREKVITYPVSPVIGSGSGAHTASRKRLHGKDGMVMEESAQEVHSAHGERPVVDLRSRVKVRVGDRVIG